MERNKEEISVRVHIGNRTYPLKVQMSEEEYVRKAAKLINEKIATFTKIFPKGDVQDLLATSALDIAIALLNEQNKPENKTEEKLSPLLANLEKQLAQMDNSF
jgi:cell division protein ZapA (FtsZ GTPase activity inhibitor)